MILLNSQQKKASGNKLDDSMIPAINIVFLLLIFFMIAGQIESRNEQLLIPSSASNTELAEQEISIQVRANGDYYLNNELVTSSLHNNLKLLTTSPTAIISCRIHKDLSITALDPVLDAVRLLGIKRLHIVTESIDG